MSDELISITAAVSREPNGPFSIEQLTLEPPRPDEVLVRIVAAGMCHTDLMAKDAPQMPHPMVLGHEGAGVVERVGSAVRKLEPGDHVVLTFMHCGRCPRCLAGEPSYCERIMPLCFGGAREDGTTATHGAQGPIHDHFFGQSSFATYALASERNAVKVPKDAPLELLGPFGCGLPTGAGSVINALKVGVGQSLAVFGAGAVGMAAIMAARIVGATTIVAVDLVDSRLELALELGATHVVNGRARDVVEQVRAATAGRGMDFSLDATGTDKVMTMAMQVLGTRGALGFVGGAPPGATATVDLAWLMTAGRSLRGILEGDAVPDMFIPALIELHRLGRFPFEKLVKVYELKDINQAAHDSESGKVIKPVIRMPV
ncbi:MAG TPA: NAD(P)-dependent alcohol dehydrogenase [Rhizomicrobium sp.]